ncbi:MULTISPECIES: hypothetical protein [unclassified Frankia]
MVLNCRGMAAREAGVDAGGSASDLVQVGGQLGDLDGVGVQDPAVWMAGLLASADAALLAPAVDGSGGDAEVGG